MKATVTEFEFVQEMRKEKYGFSYEGAEALFFYINLLNLFYLCNHLELL